MTNTIKEIVIMLLVCLGILLLLAILLYQYIPSRKQVPEIVTYSATEEVQDLLEDDIITRMEDKEPIERYKVTASDISSYQKQQEYIPGKLDPFAEYSSETTGTETNTTTSGNTEQKEDKEEEKPALDTKEPTVYENGNKGSK